MTARTDGPFNRALMACQVPEWIIYFLSPVSGQARGKAQTAADTLDCFSCPQSHTTSSFSGTHILQLKTGIKKF